MGAGQGFSWFDMEVYRLAWRCLDRCRPARLGSLSI